MNSNVDDAVVVVDMVVDNVVGDVDDADQQDDYYNYNSYLVVMGDTLIHHKNHHVRARDHAHFLVYDN